MNWAAFFWTLDAFAVIELCIVFWLSWDGKNKYPATAILFSFLVVMFTAIAMGLTI